MTTPTSGPGRWIAGARPRTLPAAVVPVAVGTAAAVGEADGTAWWRAGVALIVAVALQVGVNYANDYSDGVRGTDGGDRVGPLRLVGSGLASPSAVKRAATLAFAVAGVAGTVLASVVGPEIFVVGALCLLAGWGYTGGPRPYGYLGLGEVFVFVFFGLVATVGTTYVLLEEFDGLSLACSVPVGFWATALLVVNNLRDIPGDARAGKRTLAVRVGDTWTRLLFTALHVGAMLMVLGITLVTGRATVAAAVALPWVFGAVGDVRRGASGIALIPVLATTGRAQLVAGLAMAVGLGLTG